MGHSINCTAEIEMNIKNDCGFPVIAFGYHTDRGYGNDVEIPAGDARSVSGPYLGEMGNGDCYVYIPGEIVVHEGQDDESGYQIVAGEPLFFGGGGKLGIVVRHHDDEPESHVLEWRNVHSRPSDESIQVAGHGEVQKSVFSEGDFREALRRQGEAFSIDYHDMAWKLAPGVFCARISEKGSRDWTDVFFFDDREVKARDEESRFQQVYREVHLLSMLDVTVGRLSKEPEDHVRIAYLEGPDTIRENPVNILKFGTQILVRTDNKEIPWFEESMPINLS